MMDGNFQGEHMKMRNPSDDVRLADGKGFFVEDQRYKDHLRASPVSAPVCFYYLELSVCHHLCLHGRNLPVMRIVL